MVFLSVEGLSLNTDCSSIISYQLSNGYHFAHLSFLSFDYDVSKSFLATNYPPLDHTKSPVVI